jgi:hypothetical protein
MEDPNAMRPEALAIRPQGFPSYPCQTGIYTQYVATHAGNTCLAMKSIPSAKAYNADFGVRAREATSPDHNLGSDVSAGVPSLEDSFSRPYLEMGT